MASPMPQIILRWHIQDGNIVIPGSKNPTHIKDNFALFDFELTEEEMARIAALDKNTRYYTSTPQMLKSLCGNDARCGWSEVKKLARCRPGLLQTKHFERRFVYMRKTKKFAALILAGVLCVSVLAGCAGNESSTTSAESLNTEGSETTETQNEKEQFDSESLVNCRTGYFFCRRYCHSI